MSDMGVHSTEAWTQPASWKKRGTGGEMKIRHIFMKVRGEERLNGKKDKAI